MFRSALTVSSFTLLSRILGFFRDILVATTFGSGVFSDAYFVAFRIPNLLRSIFAEGALTSAFVPTFTEEAKKNDTSAQAAFSTVATFLIVTTTIFTITGIFFSDYIVDLFAPGFKNTPEIRTLCIQLTMIMMPYIICVSLVSLLNGVLNTYGIYGASAKAQVYMNCALIAGGCICLFIHDLTIAAYILSVSVLIGGIVQVITQLPAIHRQSLRLILTTAFYSNATKQTIKLMLPAILGATIYQLTIMIMTMFASLQEAGSVSWLFYADRIIQLPIGVFSIALASVLLPHLSQARVNKDNIAFHQYLLDSLRYSSFVLIPIIGFIYLYTESIVSLLFERGAFDQTAVINTARAVRIMSFGIWFTTCHSMMTRALISRNDTKTPTLIGGISLISTVFFIIIFSGNSVTTNDQLSQLIRQSAVYLHTTYSLGFAGLPLSSTLSTALSFLLIFIILSYKETGINWKIFIVSTLKTLAAVVLTILILNSLFINFFNGNLLLYFVIQGILFYVIFLTISFILGNRELKDCSMKLYGKIIL